MLYRGPVDQFPSDARRSRRDGGIMGLAPGGSGQELASVPARGRHARAVVDRLFYGGRRTARSGARLNWLAMMQRLDLRGRSPVPARASRGSLPGTQFDVDAALHSGRTDLRRGRAGGGDALRDLAERYDGVRPPRLRVPDETLAGGPRRTGP